MHEGRPQRYGTQWLDDSVDGRTRPWKLAEAERVNELRAESGLGPMHPVPERGPELLAEEQQALSQNQRWWENWLASKGWRLSPGAFCAPLEETVASTQQEHLVRRRHRV